MKKTIIILLVWLGVLAAQNQLITWTPYFCTDQDSVTVIFDATQGNGGLSGYAGDVYAHTGVITNLSTSGSDWKYVKTNWGVNTPETKLERIGTNLYRFKIQPSIRSFYNVPAAEQILKIAFVFRSSASPYKEGKTAEGGDIFLTLSSGTGFSVAIASPNSFPYIILPSATVPVQIQASGADTLSLYIENQFISKTTSATLSYNYIPSTAGRKWIKAVAVKSGVVKADSVAITVRPTVTDASLPSGVRDGINYISPTSVTLVLHAPMKSFIYVIGEFSNWDALPELYMKRTPDGQRWWVTIENLSPGNEYAYQYLVDGSMRIPDPYSEMILDPWNDSYIGALIYPNLKPYPTGKTSQLVTVMQPGQSAYNWQVPNFQKPAKEKLVIYELLLRDFLANHNYQGLIDTLNYIKNLGVNCIELMPVNEFDGNLSWGYNPALHGAVDKYYGPRNDLKKFIDKCHQNGIAVVFDVVFNHAFGNHPYVRLWWDAVNNKPSSSSPYFNPDAKHPYNVGYDFNHESQATKDYMDNILKFFLTDYKVDGFRFDLSKGFTQKYTGADVGAWGNYDQSRIDLLKRMAAKVWATDASAYIILEHFADNSEEVVLANAGMMLWGKMTSNYNEATMGWHDNGKSDFNWISYKNRGYSSPNLVGYMESHDEERLMVKNLLYGNSSGSYNIKDLNTALDRMKMAGAFFFTVPGPKMLWQFGELGYDVTIQYPCGTDACRTDQKPLKWEYYTVAQRNKLYRVYSALIGLKKNYPAFSSTDFSMDVAGSFKRITIAHSSMNVVIVGNFDVVSGSIAGNFHANGTWYDYFTGNSYNVTSGSQQVQLAPGEFHIFTSVKLPTPDPNIVNVESKELGGTVPASYLLEQNYPNPFNPSTIINYQLPKASMISLKIFDMLGNEVMTLIDGNQAAGSYGVTFNAAGLASGVYYYQLKADNFTSTRKLVLLK